MEKTLTGTTYLVYDKPTIADLLILCELDQHLPEAFGLFDFTPFPKISAWMNRIKTEIPAYTEVFSPVIEVAQKMKK